VGIGSWMDCLMTTFRIDTTLRWTKNRNFITQRLQSPWTAKSTCLECNFIGWVRRRRNVGFRSLAFRFRRWLLHGDWFKSGKRLVCSESRERQAGRENFTTAVINDRVV